MVTFPNALLASQVHNPYYILLKPHRHLKLPLVSVNANQTNPKEENEEKKMKTWGTFCKITKHMPCFRNAP